jgi:hypothetical protein
VGDNGFEKSYPVDGEVIIGDFDLPPDTYTAYWSDGTIDAFIIDKCPLEGVDEPDPTGDPVDPTEPDEPDPTESPTAKPEPRTEVIPLQMTPSALYHIL